MDPKTRGGGVGGGGHRIGKLHLNCYPNVYSSGLGEGGGGFCIRLRVVLVAPAPSPNLA